MKKITNLAIAIVVLLFLASCSKPDSSQSNQGGEQVKNKKAQAERIFPVKVSTVKKSRIIDYLPFSGRIEGITDITMKSEVSGKVLKVNKKLGDYIKKGEEIGRIDNLDYKIKVTQANSDLLAAEANLEAAKINLETTETLYKDGSLSKLDFVNASSSCKKAQAQYEGSKATLEIAKRNYNNTRFLASASGYITSINLEEGETISNGAVVCQIVDFNQVKILTGFGDKDIHKVFKDQTIELSYEGFQLSGRVVGIGFKPGSNETYPVEILVDNDSKKLLPGMVINGKIESKIYNNVISINLSNIVEEYGKHYVYIVKDNKAQKRILKIKAKIDRDYVIESGINENEQLVVSGKDNLQDGVKVEIIKN